MNGDFPLKTKKNRSEVIRDHLRSLRPSDRSPTAVAATLNSKGFKVTRNHVSVIKTQMTRGRTASVARELLLAKRFVAAVGSPAEARKLVTIVGRIMD